VTKYPIFRKNVRYCERRVNLSLPKTPSGLHTVLKTPGNNVSEAPLPLDPALAEVIFEWRRRTEFSANSDFVLAGLGPIGWHHTYRAWLGDNGEPLTVQKELMRHASIQTTLNTYGGGMMDSMREAHGQAMPR
jgi:hypothetical protein